HRQRKHSLFEGCLECVGLEVSGSGIIAVGYVSMGSEPKSQGLDVRVVHTLSQNRPMGWWKSGLPLPTPPGAARVVDSDGSPVLVVHSWPGPELLSWASYQKL